MDSDTSSRPAYWLIDGDDATVVERPDETAHVCVVDRHHLREIPERIDAVDRTKRSSIMRLRFALTTLVARVDDDMFRWLCDRSRVRAGLRAAALVIAAVTSTLLAYVAIA